MSGVVHTTGVGMGAFTPPSVVRTLGGIHTTPRAGMLVGVHTTPRCGDSGGTFTPFSGAGMLKGIHTTLRVGTLGVLIHHLPIMSVFHFDLPASHDHTGQEPHGTPPPPPSWGGLSIPHAPSCLNTPSLLPCVVPGDP